MTASGVFFGKIIGIFPLVNVIVRVCVVHSTVVVVDTSAYFQISESDTSGKTSKILNGSVVSSEEVKDSFGFGICDVEYFLFLDSGMVGSVGDWSGVVGRVELAVADIAHMIRQ